MNFKDFKSRFQKRPVVEYQNSVNPEPLLSVCVQTYQHENFIKKSLDSILLQNTNFRYEILIGEDGSNDGTREICMEYANKFPERIRLFLHNRDNQIKILNEPTGNFNVFYNFFSARGKYIAVCEGDDYWSDPLKLQKQVDFLKNKPSYSLIFHKYQIIDKKGELIQGMIFNQPENDICQEDLMRVKYHPLFLTVCFRNNFKEFPVQVTEVINVDTFILSLLGQNGKAKFDPNISPGLHRIHKGGIWGKRKKDKKFLLKIVLFSKLEEFYNEEGKIEFVSYFRIRKNNYIKSLVVFYLKSGKIGSLLRIFFSSYRLS